MPVRPVLVQVWALLLGAILVLCSLGSIPNRPTRANDDPVSQGAEPGTLVARRAESNDDLAGPPFTVETPAADVIIDVGPAWHSARLWTAERVGSSSPRGPPSIL